MVLFQLEVQGEGEHSDWLRLITSTTTVYGPYLWAFAKRYRYGVDDLHGHSLLAAMCLNTN